jgi:hypothetical protein
LTPPRNVEVHPDVIGKLDNADNIPETVKGRVADALEALTHGPVPGHVDPVLDARVHIIEEWHEGMLWRFVFTIVEDGDTVSIVSVVLGHPH